MQLAPQVRMDSSQGKSASVLLLSSFDLEPPFPPTHFPCWHPQESASVSPRTMAPIRGHARSSRSFEEHDCRADLESSAGGFSRDVKRGGQRRGGKGEEAAPATA
ncbi:hypothetical protein KM043_012706 [Ampulex compressa]|nr:hypothetical protein KM043_012706 [Ampulex compressa]